jgi:hypothetical protein
MERYSDQEERILSEKRQSKNDSFDLRPVYKATINDLSRGFFEDEYLPSVNVPACGNQIQGFQQKGY